MQIPYALAIAAFIALAAGCDGQKRDAKSAASKAANDPLAKVSPYLVIMEFNTKIGAQVNCAIRDGLAKSSNTSSVQKSPGMDQLVEKMRLSSDAKCNLFQGAIEKSSAVFKSIRDQGTVPNDVYAFSIMEERDDGRDFAEHEMGLFSAADCNSLESFARSHDLATKRCRLWVK